MIDPFSFSSEVGNVEVYWILQTMFYLSMIICGRGITYSKGKVYNLYCIASILIFSIYEGLRWLRGADYAHYYTDLTQNILSRNPEPLYKLIVNIFSNFSFYYAFIFYGFLLISPVVLFLRKYKKEAYWILPLFIIIITGGFETHVRQYIAMGFFLFGFYFWTEGKEKICLLFYLATVMTHMAVFFPVFVFFMCITFSYIRYEIKYAWIPLSLFTYLYWFWDISYLGDFANYLRFIDLGDDIAFNSYVEESGRWFTEEGSISFRTGVETSSALITRIVFFLLNAMTIYWGYHYRKISITFNVFYWFTFWALIIKCIAVDIEIILRFYNMLLCMMPFMMGIIVCNLKEQKMVLLYKCLILLYYVGYTYLLHLGTRPYSGCGYIWDR